MQSEVVKAQLQSVKDAIAVTLPDVERLESLGEQITSAEAQLKVLEAKLAEARRAHESLTANHQQIVKRMDEEIGELTKKRDGLNAEVAAAKQELDETKAQINSARLLHQEALNNIAELRKQIVA
jgi:chromosome segregation ATPase